MVRASPKPVHDIPQSTKLRSVDTKSCRIAATRHTRHGWCTWCHPGKTAMHDCPIHVDSVRSSLSHLAGTSPTLFPLGTSMAFTGTTHILRLTTTMLYAGRSLFILLPRCVGPSKTWLGTNLKIALSFRQKWMRSPSSLRIGITTSRMPFISSTSRPAHSLTVLIAY